MNPLSSPFQPALAMAAALCMAAPAWAQQEAPAYNPPSFIIIAPSGGPNPYLMYVPVPQPVPAPAVPVVPAAPATPAAPAQPPQPLAVEAPPAGPTLSDLGKSLRNYFTEDELDLLFEYMKESVVAAFKGEEVTLPPDLAFKLEVLLVRLQKEGGMYMDNLVQQLERDLKRSLKEKLLPPPQPPAPATLPSTEPASTQPAAPAAPAPSNSAKPPLKKAAKSG
jgi:hypothetical protein